MNQEKQHRQAGDTLVVCHCYSGDRQQVVDLLPMFVHHGHPVVIISPCDFPVTHMDKHICVCAGEKSYTGQKSWDRQYLQLKSLLQFPQKWFLLNDSDSFCLTPKLPDYLYEDEDMVWSNQVDDFRKPGQNWEHYKPIPHDYHKGYPIIAMQPPYFLSRKALQAIVDTCEGLIACPITPYIDWWWIPAVYKSGLKHQCFHNAVSCESQSHIGQRWMRHRISQGAEFIHSVKSARTMRDMIRHAPRR